MNAEEDVMERINQVIKSRIRPQLMLHNGDMKVVGFSDGVLRFQMLGQCAGCVSADITSEEIVESELVAAVPEVRRAVLVQHVSDDLIKQAYAILHHER